jgi:RHS repeat-associated protein
VGAKTLVPGGVNAALDPRKLVADSYGTYTGLDPILVEGNLRSYKTQADLNSDGRVNGLDHILASFTDEQDIYDIEAFTYDMNGNRTKLTQNGDAYTYEYGIRNRLEKVFLQKKGATAKNLFIEYAYDANGNTTQRTIHKETGNEVVTFEYDTLNRVTKSTEGSKWTSYRYDNAGNRFIKEGSDGSVSLYLRHGQIAVALDIELAKTTETSFKGKLNRYVLSGDLLAGRVAKTVAMDDQVTITKSWYHLDHLNSTKCVTDANGAVEVNYTYRAFGEQLKRLDAAGQDTSDKAKYSYGGKELDDAINLYYFNARYYDATIGRFISVDPIQDGSNWYVYCANSPLSFKDPTGLKLNEDDISWTVEDKDTLSDITQNVNEKYGTNFTVEELQKFNGIKEPRSIRRGDILKLPTEEWTAVEGMGTIGYDIRGVDTGGTAKIGEADVEFSSGERHFKERYRVVTFYSFYLGGQTSVGIDGTVTIYKKLLPKGISAEAVKRNYEGTFETYSISPVTFANASGAIGFSVENNYFDRFSLGEPAPNAWRGAVFGLSLGLSAPIAVGATKTNYKIMDEETRRALEFIFGMKNNE